MKLNCSHFKSSEKDMSIFEVIMLVCFGAAWPVSIYKSWKSRQVGSKSARFLAMVLIGYISGIIHKIQNNLDPVVWLYALNGLMVSVDLMLYFRNKKIELSK